MTKWEGESARSAPSRLKETERAEISALVSLGMLTQREVPYLRHRSTQCVRRTTPSWSEEGTTA